MSSAGESGNAWYVYGVADADVQPPAGVEAVREGRVAALVSRVREDELDEDAVQARLADPAWLAERAVAHEAVLEAALGAGAVVPFRLLTVYRDGEELRRFLVAHDDVLHEVIGRVRGHVEVGIKAFVDRARLERSIAQGSRTVADLDEQIAEAKAGRAYLLQRQRDEAMRAEATHVLGDVAQASHASLLAAAREGVANPVQAVEVTGRDEEMILNGAYLVPLDGGRFELELEAVRERYEPLGVTFERTGPWPPYNFVPRDLGS